jgi:hypothetical protein
LGIQIGSLRKISVDIFGLYNSTPWMALENRALLIDISQQQCCSGIDIQERQKGAAGFALSASSSNGKTTERIPEYTFGCCSARVEFASNTYNEESN